MPMIQPRYCSWMGQSLFSSWLIQCLMYPSGFFWMFWHQGMSQNHGLIMSLPCSHQCWWKLIMWKKTALLDWYLKDHQHQLEDVSNFLTHDECLIDNLALCSCFKGRIDCTGKSLCLLESWQTFTLDIYLIWILITRYFLSKMVTWG